MGKELLRKIPSVDRVLKMFPDGSKETKEAVRKGLDKLRKAILENQLHEITDEIIRKFITKEIEKAKKFNLRRVINATGVIIHTNLGRAPIDNEVAEHLKEIITGYSNLELNLETGKRGIRYQNVKELLKELTDAEDVCVVNNNAAAVLLVLSALAAGKEVIVSRGELIEIGGSFRIPDVMKQSGAILKEVGTTNKTHLKDYEEAISENTGLLLKVHTSNYKVLGFTESVDSKQLVELGRKHGIPVYEDLGSGSFIDVRHYGLSYEPTVQNIVKSGVDVISFSGDKLLGSAQAGIIIGKKELIEKIKRHPLNRALRIDKMTLAVLEATLKLYKNEEYQKIPVWRMISEPENSIKARAEKLHKLLAEKLPDTFSISVNREEAEIGGGALPLETLPTFVVEISIKDKSEEAFYELLRKEEPPVIGRLKNGKLLLDMRTVKEEEIEVLSKSVLSVAKKLIDG
ncbi:L-seryl-tRNA(Sec) selenium transferase [Desulfurobacterium indicum]|uniref:L-seryl-tRNA(Sec) selenium transferase n=1 Tax=Desulfurobacterium indicum TaxID=1914305 RepID=A0A1R1MN34_9BACT|nr:L-seryl-tRNA(Sec) selenium transferase [Desulfurobacterium indicum]OMH41187.1 L-seryl-tRNA(Sec) selenium transferase [Desulfurobacterium indicum]